MVQPATETLPRDSCYLSPAVKNSTEWEMVLNTARQNELELSSGKSVSGEGSSRMYNRNL